MKNRKIPPSYYESIKEKILWREVLLKLGVKFKKTVKKGSAGSGSGDYRCKCVFHKEKTASLAFFENTMQFHCWGCGEHGDIFQFISRYMSGNNNYNLARTCRWLKKCFDIDLPW